MLALPSLLQTQRDWPGALLAERLEVTPRTIRRDVERLRDLGYEIGSTPGPDGGYRLSAGSRLPPLLFDDQQAVALAIALQTVTGAGVDVAEAAERVLATVRQVMPARLRPQLDSVRFSGTPADASVSAEILRTVAAAARDRQLLRFEYGDGRAVRRLEPHAVVARGSRWYVVGWERTAEDWRIFRLDRMRPRGSTGPGFIPRDLPAADAQSFLAARVRGATSDDAWPFVGHLVIDLPVDAVTRFLSAAELLGAVEVTSQSTEISLGSWSWVGVLASVARFDAAFSVLGPPPLEQAARDLAVRLHGAVNAGVADAQA